MQNTCVLKAYHMHIIQNDLGMYGEGQGQPVYLWSLLAAYKIVGYVKCTNGKITGSERNVS